MSSFGEELKRERELREISLREISEATKVNLRYLDALERNDFERLPGGVFNKGFVRAYAEYIGVDPETMVNAYLLEERGQQSERVGGLSEDLFRPSRDSAVRHTPVPDVPDDGSGSLGRAVAVVVVIGVVAAAAWLAWWWWSGRDEPDAEGPPAIERTVATEEVEEPPATKPDDVPEPESAAGTPAASGEVTEPAPVPAEPAPAAETREAPAAADSPGSRVPQVRVVLTRPTQGRLNCDNRRVEILDGMATGTAMVFRCREFLLVDALDGGAVMVQPEGSEATPLGPDGLPVVGRYLVPARPRSSGGEP